jgi:hypothetical protein
MTDWTSKWRKVGGWFNEQIRHSNAARFGKAGGKYHFAKRENIVRISSKAPDKPEIVKIEKGEPSVDIKTVVPIGRSRVKLKEELLKGTVRITPVAEEIEEKRAKSIKKTKEELKESALIAAEKMGEAVGRLEAIQKSMRPMRERTKFIEAAPTATTEANVAAIEVLRRGGSLKEARTEAMKQYARRGFPLESVKDETGKIVKWGARDLYAPEEKSLALIAKQTQAVKLQEFREKHLEPILKSVGVGLSPILPQMLTPAQKLAKLRDEATIRALEASRKRQEERAFGEAMGGGGPINPFNPLKNISFGSLFQTQQPLKDQMGFGAAPERREPTKQEIHPEAVHLEKEINDLYQGRGALKDNSSKSSYDKGVSAFSKGNREKLVESVNELQAEKRKLIDRNVWLDQSRARLMKEETKQSFIDMEGSGSGLFNFGFGGSGTRKLAELSKKLTAAKSDVWKEVNKNEIRMHNLTDKLARLDARMNPGRYEPVTPESSDIVPFSGVAGGAVFTGIDNPLLSKKRPGPILRNDTVSYLLFEPHIKYGSAKIENMNENPIREAK